MPSHVHVRGVDGIPTETVRLVSLLISAVFNHISCPPLHLSYFAMLVSFGDLLVSSNKVSRGSLPDIVRESFIHSPPDIAPVDYLTDTNADLNDTWVSVDEGPGSENVISIRRGLIEALGQFPVRCFLEFENTIY